MHGTCPRCGVTRVRAAGGDNSLCPTCGFTELIVSAAPPAGPEQGEPARWGHALIGCIVVSLIVFIGALAAAHFAAFGDPAAPAQVADVRESVSVEAAPELCVDPSLWAASGH